MKALNDIILLDDRNYIGEHTWAKKDGDAFLLGISDFAQDQLGEIVYIDLPSEGDEFEKDASFGEIESVKSVNKLFMPFNGKIIEVNQNLDDSPATVNASCYEEGWIVRVKAENNADYDNLLSASAYGEFLSK